MLRYPVLVLICLFLTCHYHHHHYYYVNALYDDASVGNSATDEEDTIPIHTIVDPADFTRKVLQSKRIWMVQFYDPNSADCIQFEPIYQALGKFTQGIFRLGIVNIGTPENAELKTKYKIKEKKLPTLLIFGDDKEKPTPYTGQKDLQNLLQPLIQTIINTIQTRINHAGMGDPSSSSSSSSSGSGSGPSTKINKDSKIVQLTSSNFEQEILNSELVSAIAFTAPWCGHCKKLLPEWETAAFKLYGNGAKLGWVDATVETELANQFAVKSYPTIIMFPGTKDKTTLPKTIQDAIPYPSGDRSSDIITQTIFKLVDQTTDTLSLIHIPQLLSKDILLQHCGEHNTICVIAALPHILDSGKEGRHKYLDILKQTYHKAFRGSAFKMMWFEGGSAQMDMEAKLELTFGYPAVVALSVERKAYTVMAGSFNQKSITTFLHSIVSGRQSTIPLDELPTISTTEPWDGEDGEMVEEEFSLDDIMGDEF